MRKLFICRIVLVFSVLILTCTVVDAQIKYYPNGKMTIGNATPHATYHYAFDGAGMYLTFMTGNFFQIDVTPAATRLASHYDQVVFYNSKTNVFNSIQVKNVYNYSDARAKTNIQSLSNGLGIISRLRPVTYDFKDDYVAKFSAKSDKEIGLLAQEVETVLPNSVITDEEGKKLINYTSLIPILIDAVKTLQAEVEALKMQQKAIK